MFSPITVSLQNTLIRLLVPFYSVLRHLTTANNKYPVLSNSKKADIVTSILKMRKMSKQSHLPKCHLAENREARNEIQVFRIPASSSTNTSAQFYAHLYTKHSRVTSDSNVQFVSCRPIKY